MLTRVAIFGSNQARRVRLRGIDAMARSHRWTACTAPCLRTPGERLDTLEVKLTRHGADQCWARSWYNIHSIYLNMLLTSVLVLSLLMGHSYALPSVSAGISMCPAIDRP